jgi:hypothetical protein
MTRPLDATWKDACDGREWEPHGPASPSLGSRRSCRASELATASASVRGGTTSKVHADDFHLGAENDERDGRQFRIQLQVFFRESGMRVQQIVSWLGSRSAGLARVAEDLSNGSDSATYLIAPSAGSTHVT